MPVIGISGAQGGGKSSLLNKLKEWGYKVDDFRVSRAVQAELGWDSLERVMDAPDTMMAFQDEVLEQKLNNDRKLRESSEVILTERTFADIYSYTSTWVNKFIDRGDLDLGDGMRWLQQYTAKCFEYQQQVYQAVILLPLMPHVVFENDPHRAKQEDAEVVYGRIERFAKGMVDEVPYCRITEKSIVDRASEVERFLKALS